MPPNRRHDPKANNDRRPIAPMGQPAALRSFACDLTANFIKAILGIRTANTDPSNAHPHITFIDSTAIRPRGPREKD
jgi:hypothetical protein